MKYNIDYPMKVLRDYSFKFWIGKRSKSSNTNLGGKVVATEECEPLLKINDIAKEQPLKEPPAIWIINL